jgi:hypothetical protein
MAVDPFPLTYRQTAFPLYFAESVIRHYPLSIIQYHLSQLLLCSQDNSEVARHNTFEKVKDN